MPIPIRQYFSAANVQLSDIIEVTSGAYNRRLSFENTLDGTKHEIILCSPEEHRLWTQREKDAEQARDLEETADRELDVEHEHFLNIQETP